MPSISMSCMYLDALIFAGTRFSDGDGSSNEVQRTMLELINQLDGFDPRGNIKVLMATNRYVHVHVPVYPVLSNSRELLILSHISDRTHLTLH